MHREGTLSPPQHVQDRVETAVLAGFHILFRVLRFSGKDCGDLGSSPRSPQSSNWRHPQEPACPNTQHAIPIQPDPLCRSADSASTYCRKSRPAFNPVSLLRNGLARSRQFELMDSETFKDSKFRTPGGPSLRKKGLIVRLNKQPTPPWSRFPTAATPPRERPAPLAACGVLDKAPPRPGPGATIWHDSNAVVHGLHARNRRALLVTRCAFGTLGITRVSPQRVAIGMRCSSVTCMATTCWLPRVCAT